MTIEQYLLSINKRFQLGNATEHTFRSDLQLLIESLQPLILATNEPKRQECGAPDYVITKKGIPIGFIEAKDIGVVLNSKAFKDSSQFQRYTASLSNLIFTDYLDFHFYCDGAFVTSIRIADAINGKILPLQQNFQQFCALLNNFCQYNGQTITNAQKLASMMAAKATMLALTLENALRSDDVLQENSTLHDQLNAFKDILIHDITPKDFADIYAQTIAYGMFAARLHDPSLTTFSRQEAAELIPKSNPFLRKLFQYIAGYDLDSRITWIVDALADIFRATDVAAILNNFGKSTQQHDPIIHFYETFLAEYDPKLRKARGVWYTPEPVVQFIVRAVDDILKTDFNLPQGLADTSKTSIKLNTQTPDKRSASGFKQIQHDIHRVQILDPATGTGTFLAEVVKHIHKKFQGQQGIWSNYVENHLIPRLNGFELLMASYAMAHLKIDLLLSDTGFKPQKEQRLRIFLTNSLEEHHPDTGTLFASWLSNEANEANNIKRDTPVMVVIGNPPYAVSSSNNSTWIQNLLEDYKKDLNERNIQPLSDDYIKFIRFGQHFIEKNGEGILAYISNNSFIDGIIHRQMRKHLLESFDKIYILDLHGSTKKKEVCSDGSQDQNIFDIMQGVSINIFVKTGKKNPTKLGDIFHNDVMGKRNEKYDFLCSSSINSITWNRLSPNEPEYFMVPKNFNIDGSINHFKIDELFTNYNSGLTTEFDELAIHSSSQDTYSILRELQTMKAVEIEQLYKFGKKKLGKIHNAISDIAINNPIVKTIYYRPFDYKHTIYTGKTNGVMGRPRFDLMKHFFCENIGLIIGRQGQAVGSMQWNVLTITNTIVDCNIFYRGRGTVFPLYLYPDNLNQQSIDNTHDRTPNFNRNIVDKIASSLGLQFTNEKTPDNNSFAPIDLLDYIYAVLHSPSYREKYKEFLKIDFPRVPYPKDTTTFWKLAKLGAELRLLHLLEAPTLENYITSYPEGGDNSVTRSISKKDWHIIDDKKQLGRLFINDQQYFDNIPLVAWQFYIGGYQPAQKWLKDRRGRTLSFEDILHYQKIILALSETHRIMQTIDSIEFE